MRLPKECFLDLLQKEHNITDDMRNVLVTEQKISNQPLEHLALDTGTINEDDLVRFFAEQRNCPIARLSNHTQSIASLIPMIAFKDLEENTAVPFKIDKEKKIITFAMFDPSDIQATERIEKTLPPQHTMEVEIAKKSEILDILSTHAPLRAPSSSVQKMVNNKVVGQFLYSIFTQSIQQKASDIHFEPESFFVRVRIRHDGILRIIKSFHKSLWQEVSTQIKVLAGMNIAQSRMPQDGCFNLPVLGQSIDFRASSHPTDHGEAIVLRALRQNHRIASLKDLGYSAYALDIIQKITKKPEGLFLVTGPTGSGKTTSLYSIVDSFDKEKNNIITLEDPIECKISGIRQSEMGHGLDFYTGIRSALRQDPDIILIGEIRDEKVAETVIRASMTGHKVLSTLHTTRAIDSIERLIELGTSLHMIANTLNGIINQRLVRLLCNVCKKYDKPLEKEIDIFALEPQSPICRAVGCASCFFSGYKERKAIAEAFFIDNDIRSAIINRPTHGKIHQILLEKGFRTLEHEGAQAVRDLETSPEEIDRILGKK